MPGIPLSPELAGLWPSPMTHRREAELPHRQGELGILPGTGHLEGHLLEGHQGSGGSNRRCQGEGRGMEFHPWQWVGGDLRDIPKESMPVWPWLLDTLASGGVLLSALRKDGLVRVSADIRLHIELAPVFRLIWTWRVSDLDDILTLYRKGWAARIQHGFGGKEVVDWPRRSASLSAAASQP